MLIRVGIAVTAASAALVGCAGSTGSGHSISTGSTRPATTTIPSPSPTTAPASTSVTSASTAATYRQGVPFTTGGFKTTVTRVVTGLATTPGPRPVKARNGQFVLVYVTAQNVGAAPATFHIGQAELIDSAGRRFATSYDVLVAVGPIGNDGFDEDQQPDATTHGWIPFDVPTTVKAVSAVLLLPDDSGDVPPAAVRLS